MALGVGGDVAARIKAVVEVDSSGLTKGLREADSQVEKSGKGMAKLHGAARNLALGGFAVLGAAAVESVKGAAQLQVKMQALENTLKRNGASAKQLADAHEYLTKRSNATGTSVDDLAVAYGKMDSVTHNVVRSQKLVAEAQAISAQKNISLAAASKMVASVELGKVTLAQKQFGLLPKVTAAEDKLKKEYADQAATGKKLSVQQKINQSNAMAAAKATDLHATALAAQGVIQGKVAGAQARFDKTAAGQAQILQARLKNTEDELGSKLLPVVQTLLGFITKHTGVVEALAVAIGAVWAAATIWTTVQAALNVELSANPVGLVVIAIAALVVGLIAAYEKSATFRDVVHKAMTEVRAVVAAVVADIHAHMDTLKTIWRTVAAVAQVYFNVIKAEVTTIANVVGDVVRGVSDIIHGRWGDAWQQAKNVVHDAIHGVVTIMQNILPAIETAAEGIGTAILHAITNALSGLGGSLKQAIISAIPGGGLANKVASALGFATGGVVTGGEPGKDSVPAMLMPGEVVLSHKGVSRLGGAHAANALNFAKGGIVPPGKRKNEKGPAYNQRIEQWLQTTIGSEAGAIDFKLQLRQREDARHVQVANRDGVTSKGEYAQQLSDIAAENALRGKEISVYDRGARFARGKGWGSIARGFADSAAMLKQDIADAKQNAKDLQYARAQASASSSGSGSVAAAQISSFLSDFSGIESSFGGGTGPSAAIGGAQTAAGGVTVIQNITAPADNQHVLLQNAKHAAMAAMG